ncbi:thiamine phosphate synthase [Candidatus Pelagibacter sp.]|uniref:thiamine phosphate synthase n=1 Tax=Candidatus Pelagibacter sp. TaxID=2024849 RepID=UPI003F853225
MHINKIRKYYFINNFDTNNIDKLDKQTAIIYRDYTSKIQNEVIIYKLKKHCKKKRIKFYISNNIKLAIKFNLDGVYIPSFNKSFKHLAYSYKKNFEIIGSAHNLKEIRLKEKQSINKIFLSSLFKKNKNFLGINRFRNLKKLTERNIIALGGISINNERKLNLLNQTEFAGISYFE